jgi:hypothetical protein
VTGWVIRQNNQDDPHQNQDSHANSLLTGNFTGNFAILWLSDRVSDHESIVPQRFAAKFPTQRDREIILDNREFFCVNRESYALTVVARERRGVWLLGRYDFEVLGRVACGCNSNILRRAGRDDIRAFVADARASQPADWS